MAERCRAKRVIGFAHRLLGETALSTNPTEVRPPVAAPHFERSIAILREINAENELALASRDPAGCFAASKTVDAGGREVPLGTACCREEAFKLQRFQVAER
jgi:hypothetical protein